MSLKSKIFAPNFPFSPHRIPFFYGWIILFSSLCGRLISVPGHTVGICPFTEPLIIALGISRIHFSNILFFAALLSSLTTPLFGGIFDRIGIRRSATYSGLFLGLILLFFGNIDAIVAFFQRITSPIIVQTCILFLGFFLLKLLGQNLVPLASRTMLLHWYNRKSCTITGLAGIFCSAIFGLAPPFTQELVEQFGYLGTWKIFGVTTLLLFVPIIWATCRDSPKSLGMALDAEPQQKPSNDQVFDQAAPSGKTLREALRTFDFWIFIFAVTNSVFIMMGFSIHIVDIFREAQSNMSNVMNIFPSIAVISAISGYLLGIILDRISIYYAPLVSFLVIAFVTGAMEHVASPLGFCAFVLFSGMNWGFYGILAAVPWPKLFGRKHLAQIMSMASSIALIFSAAAPSVFAYARNLGSYSLATRTLCLISCAGSLVSFFYAHRRKTSRLT
jgi:hypothetical protein